MGCKGSKGDVVSADEPSIAEECLPASIRNLAVSKETGLYYNLEVNAVLRSTAQAIFESMNGMGTSEAALIRSLVYTGPQFKDDLRNVFETEHCSEGQTLQSWIEGETNVMEKDFRKLLLALAQDPADMDAEAIYGAMKGFGTDENCLIRTLTTRDFLHLRRVRERFERKGEGTVESWIKGDTSFDLKTVLLALQDRATFVAGEFNEAIAGFGTDDKKLIRLVSGLKRNKFTKEIVTKYEALDTTGAMRNLLEEIKEECCGVGVEDVKEAYEKLYNKSLVDAVKAETSFSYQKLCTRCLEHSGEEDARFVKEALDNGMFGIGTNDTKLIAVLVTRSPMARVELAQAYEKMYGTSVQEAVAGDTSGGYARVLDALLTPRAEYIAKCIYKAWRHGINTDEMALCRLLLHRPRPVLADIQSAYQELYDTSLVDDIEGHTSGWFKSALTYILQESHTRDLRLAHGSLKHVSDVDNFMSKAFPPTMLPRELSMKVDGVFGCWNAALFLQTGIDEELRRASQEILKAMQGMGTDEELLIRELYNVPPQFRAQLRQIYKDTCCKGDQTIESWIKGDTQMDFSGFQTLCLELTKTPYETDADALRESMVGLGTDDACLQRTLILRPAMDMPKVAALYEERDPAKGKLQEAIAGDTSYNLKEVLLAFTDPALFVAKELNEAVKVWYGTDDSKLIRLVSGLRRNEKAKEILQRYEDQDITGLSRALIEELKHELGGPSLGEVKEAYKNSFGTSLEEAIAGDTSFDYKNLLLALVEDQGLRDAKYVYEAIQNDGMPFGLGTNDSKLIAMLVLRSRYERAEIAKSYPTLYEKSVTDAIKGDTSGWYSEALLTLVKPFGEALADACNKAMKGLGTDEAALIRILGYHSKKDLRELQECYQSKYGKSLADAVASETSGWFAKGLAYILTQALADDIVVDESRCSVRKDVGAKVSASAADGGAASAVDEGGPALAADEEGAKKADDEDRLEPSARNADDEGEVQPAIEDEEKPPAVGKGWCC